MGIKFDKCPSAVEQNIYLAKNVNVYIVYELNLWPRISNLRIAYLEQIIQ